MLCGETEKERCSLLLCPSCKHTDSGGTSLPNGGLHVPLFWACHQQVKQFTAGLSQHMYVSYINTNKITILFWYKVIFFIPPFTEWNSIWLCTCTLTLKNNMFNYRCGRQKKAPHFKSATIDFVNCRCKEVSCFMATYMIQKNMLIFATNYCLVFSSVGTESIRQVGSGADGGHSLSKGKQLLWKIKTRPSRASCCLKTPAKQLHHGIWFVECTGYTVSHLLTLQVIFKVLFWLMLPLLAHTLYIL